MTDTGHLPPNPETDEAQRLLEQAARHPGVADLLRLYERHSETVRQADRFAAPRQRVTIFTTGNTTA